MAGRRATKRPKQYTIDEANAALPLVRRIVEDIKTLAHDLRNRHQRLERVAGPKNQGKTSAAHDEELERLREGLERDGARLQGYVDELTALGVELKDYFTGLLDFRCMMDGREVYLCWKLGESSVAHWHELGAGFAGRQRLVADPSPV